MPEKKQGNKKVGKVNGKGNNKNFRNNKNTDDDYNPKFKRMKKKVCPLCGDKNFVLDYKNLEQVKRFASDKGKILPRRASGACAKHQRDINIAIKRARHIAILPFTQG